MYIHAAHLVPYGFLGGEVEGVHLWKLGPQVVVELSELGVTPVHVPLVIQDPDVHLRRGKTFIINHVLKSSKDELENPEQTKPEPNILRFKKKRKSKRNRPIGIAFIFFALHISASSKPHY